VVARYEQAAGRGKDENSRIAGRGGQGDECVDVLPILNSLTNLLLALLGKRPTAWCGANSALSGRLGCCAHGYLFLGHDRRRGPRCFRPRMGGWAAPYASVWLIIDCRR